MTDVKGSPTAASSLSRPNVAPNYRPRHPSEGRFSSSYQRLSEEEQRSFEVRRKQVWPSEGAWFRSMRDATTTYSSCNDSAARSDPAPGPHMTQRRQLGKRRTIFRGFSLTVFHDRIVQRMATRSTKLHFLQAGKRFGSIQRCHRKKMSSPGDEGEAGYQPRVNIRGNIENRNHVSGSIGSPPGSWDEIDLPWNVCA